MKIPDLLTCLLRNLIQVNKQQLEPGSKLGKEYIEALYYPPAYLTYLQGTSCEMPGWMKHKLQDFWEK